MLICASYGKRMTSSKSKGRSRHYHYYHWQHGCPERVLADKVHTRIEAQLALLELDGGIVPFFSAIVEDLIADGSRETRSKQSELERERQTLSE